MERRPISGTHHDPERLSQLIQLVRADVRAESEPEVEDGPVPL